MAQSDFWDHQEKAQQTIGELKTIKSIVDDFDSLFTDLSDEIELWARELRDEAFVEYISYYD